MPAYLTPPLGAGDESKPLVIHCSDARYQPHFQDFLRNALRLEHYALIAVPGGPHTLTLTEYLPKFSWALRRWVKVMERVARPGRVILIAHDDCRWYLDMAFVTDPARLREKQTADLKAARKALLESFEGLRIELYRGAMENGRVAFEEVSAL